MCASTRRYNIPRLELRTMNQLYSRMIRAYGAPGEIGLKAYVFKYEASIAMKLGEPETASAADKISDPDRDVFPEVKV